MEMEVFSVALLVVELDLGTVLCVCVCVCFQSPLFISSSHSFLKSLIAHTVEGNFFSLCFCSFSGQMKKYAVDVKPLKSTFG